MSLSFLDSLNRQQKEAVGAQDGPVLVLAGAGSGKTRVIACRIAYLIQGRGLPPESILAVTFTNKAAEEMRRRVRELAGLGRRQPAVHTFHALCLRLLRRFGSDVGLRPGFTVYPADDRRALLRRLCREANLPERDYPPARVGAIVSEWKHRDFTGRAPRTDGWHGPIRHVFDRYQHELDALGAVDFDDLLLRGVELFECSDRARSFAETHFRHVLVDEYQDTNRVQYRLLRVLAPHGNVFVVGDEDQSIYRFRGADIRNILEFEKDFREAAVIKLEVNYRSRGAILRAAGAVIERNLDRKGKRLIASLDDGSPPELVVAENEREEAVLVTRRIEQMRLEAPKERTAILLRTHAQTRPFEEELVARGVPHRVVGGLRFYERREIKDALAYLRLMVNRHDDASFLRAVNVPSRGVGVSTLEAIERRARTSEVSLWEASGELVTSDELAGRPRLGLSSFHALVEGSAAGIDPNTPGRALRTILRRSGIWDSLEREGAAVARERRENLDQLVAAALEYEAGEAKPSLAGFLDAVSLLTDVDDVDTSTACLLLTLHAAKGLEFDAVFLGGLEEGLFPHVRASADPKGLEEERRLFYVGMTRAKHRLVLSYARARRFSYQATARRPSRFLTEIPRQWLRAAPGALDDAGSGPAATSMLRPGTIVRHASFGEGRVVDSSGRGRDQRVTVLFHKAGRKRLVAAYAKLEVLR